MSCLAEKGSLERLNMEDINEVIIIFDKMIIITPISFFNLNFS